MIYLARYYLCSWSLRFAIWVCPNASYKDLLRYAIYKLKADFEAAWAEAERQMQAEIDDALNPRPQQ